MATTKKDSGISKTYSDTGRNRVIVSNVQPHVDNGLYPVKRVVGEWLNVEADVYADGHDSVTAVLLYRQTGKRNWNEVRMQSIGNDRWQAGFTLGEEGPWEFTVKGFIDHPLTWQMDFRRRLESNDVKELNLQLQMGIDWLEKISKANPKSKREAKQWIEKLQGDSAYQNAASGEFENFLRNYPLIVFPTVYEKTLPVVAQRKRAGFSSWYSFFPRSATKSPGKHGTFKDCIELLPRIQEMGFDVIYLTPIHPIGNSFRKGKNNSLNAGPDEPGCPYAIGGKSGGHKEILEELGTVSDFKKLIAAAEEKGMEIAMDFAIQCSPDHPYVKAHPKWFKWRPDGTVQYAENPPKKYQDVLPLDFENEDWQGMWRELKSILDYWIDLGIKIFRVDNPHTKSFLFWQWCLEEINKKNPEVIFLSEAFTKPKVMNELAKKGFHQSYTYFTWRNTKAELMQYMSDLVYTDAREYYRPNFWTNTHDINPYILQSGHEPQYLIRFFLAATLSSNYGIYGPVFEQMVHDALPGREEYLDSEKYEVRYWDWSKTNKVTQIISIVNKLRNENTALQFTNNYTPCEIHNDHLMAYLKVMGDNKILCVVNLDAWNKQSGTVNIPLHLIGKHADERFVVHDLITDDKYQWQGHSNYVELDPYRLPFHIFRIEDL